MPPGISRSTCIAAAGLCAAATPAFAHHAMEGALPSTVTQALVSGLAHPVIGLDHLAFIVGAGLMAGVAGRAWSGPLFFVAGGLAGAVLHLGGADIPFVELAICLSVLAVAAALFARRAGPPPLFAGLLAIAGVLHGYAYAESIIGAEPGPLYAYLAGFSVIQYVIAAGAALIAARLVGREETGGAPALRLAAIVIAIVGVLPFAGLA